MELVDQIVVLFTNRGYKSEVRSILFTNTYVPDSTKKMMQLINLTRNPCNDDQQIELTNLNAVHHVQMYKPK